MLCIEAACVKRGTGCLYLKESILQVHDIYLKTPGVVKVLKGLLDLKVFKILWALGAFLLVESDSMTGIILDLYLGERCITRP